MKKLAATALICLSTCAVAQDSWNGSDKKLHFGVSFVLGVATANQWPNEPLKAWGVAMVPGVLKEVSDRSTTGFSGKDLVVDAIGAALGVATGRFMVSRREGKTVVSYYQEF